MSGADFGSCPRVVRVAGVDELGRVRHWVAGCGVESYTLLRRGCGVGFLRAVGSIS